MCVVKYNKYPHGDCQLRAETYTFIRAVIISIIAALVTFAGVFLVDKFNFYEPPGNDEVEKKLASVFKLIDKAEKEIDSELLFFNELKSRPSDESDINKLSKGRTAGKVNKVANKLANEEIEQLTEKKVALLKVKRELAISGAKILGAGYIAKKSFKGYKLANVVTRKELRAAIRSTGLSARYVSIVSRIAWSKIKSVKFRSALIGAGSAAAAIVMVETGSFFNKEGTLSNWWKIGLPTAVFSLVFFIFLRLASKGILE